MSETAELLGTGRKTLWRRMQRLVCSRSTGVRRRVGDCAAFRLSQRGFDGPMAGCRSRRAAAPRPADPRAASRRQGKRLGAEPDPAQRLVRDLQARRGAAGAEPWSSACAPRQPFRRPAPVNAVEPAAPGHWRCHLERRAQRAARWAGSGPAGAGLQPAGLVDHHHVHAPAPRLRQRPGRRAHEQHLGQRIGQRGMGRGHHHRCQVRG